MLNLQKAINELKRIAKKYLIVIIPCQKYFRYALDTHIHFFPDKKKLEELINIKNHTCKKIDGDWMYVGILKQ